MRNISALAALLSTVLPEVASQAQTVDICDRTQQVRDAILEAVDADDCAAVDSESLADVVDLSVVSTRNDLAKPGGRQREAEQGCCESALTAARQVARILKGLEGCSTRGVHLNQALELSHETGPPQWHHKAPLALYTTNNLPTAR